MSDDREPSGTSSWDRDLPAGLKARLASRYEIRGVLGAGGMGIVLEGFHRELERIDAIKVQSVDGDPTTESRSRALFEARAMSRLTHPNLVKVWEVDAGPGWITIACEFVAGASLADFLDRRGSLETMEAVRLLRGIAAGLEEIHRNRMVHRDLKPANVLLDRHRNPKIADFGLALAADRGFRTQSGVILGTPEYMAPEQIRSLDSDGRADLYALGIIAYEMLAGKRPFDAKTPRDLLRLQLKGVPPALGPRAPDAPPWLVELVQALLAKDPGARPASARRVLEVLAQAGELSTFQEPVPAPEALPPPPPSPPAPAPDRSAGGSRPIVAATRPVSSRSNRRPSLSPSGARVSEATRSLGVAAPSGRTTTGPRRRLPARAIAGLMGGAILAVVAVLAPGCDPPTVTSITLERNAHRVALGAATRGTGEIELAVQVPGEDAWTRGRSRGEGRMLVELDGPVIARAATGPLRVRLSFEGRILHEELLPGWIAAPLIIRHQILRVPAGEHPPGEWRVCLEGDHPGQVQEVAGIHRGDRLEFRTPDVPGWTGIRSTRWIRTGSAADPAVSPPRPVPVTMILDPGGPVRTLAGLERDRAAIKGRIRKAAGASGGSPLDPARFLELVAGSAPGPTTGTAPSGEILARFIEAGRAALDDPTLDLDRRLELRRWLGEIVRIQLWATHSDLLEPFALEPAFGSFLSVTQAPPGIPVTPRSGRIRISSPDLGDPDAPAGFDSELRRMSFATAVTATFIEGGVLLPPEGRPAALEELLTDPARTNRVDLTPEPLDLDGHGRAARLALTIWSLHPGWELRFRLKPPGRDPIEFTILNLRDRGHTHKPWAELPWKGDGDKSKGALFSWKNLPVTSSRFEIGFPVELVGGSIPEKVSYTFRSDPAFEAGERQDQAMCLVDYEWSRDPVPPAR